MQKFHELLYEKLTPYEHIIWDWNGTVVNDLEQAIDSLATLMQENGLPRITKDEYLLEFGFPIRDLYIKLGFDMENLCFDQLCDRYTEIFNRDRAFKAKLHDGMHELLEGLSHHKTQSILSAGVQWHIDEMTQHFGVNHLFDYIYGIDNLHAASKLGRGRELIEVSKIDKEQTILIGDTDHDYEVAEQLGIDCLLIADGYQAASRLLDIHHHVIPSRYSLDNSQA